MAHSALRLAAAVAGAISLAAPLASLVGCSSSESTPERVSTSASTAGTSAATTGDTNVTPARSSTVSLVDYDFEPRELHIGVGDSVTWTNNDEVDHWVVSLDPDVLDSGRMSKAASYTHGFTQPGEYRYYCSLHNYMKGTIVVQ